LNNNQDLKVLLLVQKDCWRNSM